jgi:hypothetical protein
MTLPRRRLVRPPVAPAPDLGHQRARLLARLGQERIALARWMARLRRAFHAVEKYQRSITRLERQLAHQEENHARLGR